MRHVHSVGEEGGRKMMPVEDSTLHPLEATAPADILGALARMGRTEDITFSADGTRLAIAGFGTDSVAVLDVRVDDKPGQPAVSISGLTQLWSPALRAPHGVAFLGDRALVVANREGEAPIFELPAPVAGIRDIDAHEVTAIGRGGEAALVSPGSVRAMALAADVYEVLVCDNAANAVTRHLVDVRDGIRVVAETVLARAGLAIPDSLASSPDGRWLAVSNHDTHSVYVFASAGRLTPEHDAVGQLHNVTYPHGLVFTADGQHVIVADAGAPFLHVYARGDADWTGRRNPVRSIRVMDDKTFLRGRYNIQEGGPKGLDIDATSSVVAVSSEHQALAFFDLADVLGASAEGGSPDIGDANAERYRDELLREVRTAVASRYETSVVRSQVDQLEHEATDLTARITSALATAQERAEQLAVLEAVLTTTRETSGVAAAHAEREVAALRAELSRAAADRAEVEANAAHLLAIVTDRDAQLDAVRRSTSWRMTRPLRRLASRRRRG